MNTGFTETSLMDSRSCRDSFVARTEVLGKVKELILIPELEVMTTKMVADYYEVPIDTIQTCYNRNKNEIDMDGAVIKKLNEIKCLRSVQNEHIVQERTKALVVFPDFTIDVPNTGIRVFSKRAVLRIAMLLRDSIIAKEVRTQLLNTFEHATVEQRTAEIDVETDLHTQIGKAFAAQDLNAFAHAAMKLGEYRERHINKLTQELEQKTMDNKILAREILSWTDRASLNKAVNVLARKTGFPQWQVFVSLYNELKYKHGISLTRRGAKPLIQHIREDEWDVVVQTFAALCENWECSPTEVLAKAKF